ncbi:MAG: hypothetical protein AAF236_07745 [Verrucomicrobiota bacterium]
MKDTPPEVNERLFREMMAKSPAERVRIGMRMAALARKMVWASIPDDLPEIERRRQFFERFYGEPAPF